MAQAQIFAELEHAQQIIPFTQFGIQLLKLLQSKYPQATLPSEFSL